MNYNKKGVEKAVNPRTLKKARRRSRNVFRMFKAFLLVVFLLGCLGAAVGYGMIRGIIDDAPEVTLEDVIPSQQKSVIYDANGKTIQTLVQAGSNRTNIKNYDNIPENLVNAFVAIEDSRFWEHNGIDPKGIARAAVHGIMNGFHFSEGASTITQQLIKNNVFTEWTEENSLGDKIERKIQEQYLAVQLEKDDGVTKKDIMLAYLNTINCGNNTLGIYQASKRYFGKSYKKLTLSECAVLAAITNNPSQYNPITNPDENRKRVKKILENMIEQGYITKEEAAEALEDDVYSRISKVNESYENQEETVNSYFVDSVIEQVSEKLQEERGYTEKQANNLLYSGGLKIYTTLDPSIQEILDDEVNNTSYYPSNITKYTANFMITVTYADGTTETFTEISLKQYFKEKNSNFQFMASSKSAIKKYIRKFANSIIDKDKGESWELTTINYILEPQVSMTIMEQDTGYVRAITGGRGKKTSNMSLNRATDSTRQPGSLFKVLAAAAPAINECGDTLATTYYDGPYTVNKKEFSNYWSSGYKGYSTIRQALVYSMNIVTLKCFNMTVTPELGYKYLQNFGFTTLVKDDERSTGVYTDITPSLCLGGLTDGVTNLETTAAYATIANGGVYTEPRFYTQVLDSDGNVILGEETNTHRVLKKTTAFLLTDAMSECMEGNYYTGTGLTGTGAAADFSGMSTAGKTGTTSNDCDYWFAGFTPYYTAVIWTGYDDQAEIPTDTSYHKTIWRAVMSRLHAGLTDTGFKKPKGLVTAYVCSKSGKLATSACSHDARGSYAYKEYFVDGTEPTEYCDHHYSVKFCSVSGKRANSTCTSTYVKGYMSLGKDADGYSQDSDYQGTSSGYCTIDHKSDSSKSSDKDSSKKKSSSDSKTSDSKSSDSKTSDSTTSDSKTSDSKSSDSKKSSTDSAD